jgi:hypothetical protein
MARFSNGRGDRRIYIALFACASLLTIVCVFSIRSVGAGLKLPNATGAGGAFSQSACRLFNCECLVRHSAVTPHHDCPRAPPCPECEPPTECPPRQKSTPNNDCPQPKECPPLPACEPEPGSSGTSANASDLLQPFSKYQPKMEPRALRRSVYSRGDPSRLRRFVAKLTSGVPVSIVALGGSVASGQGATDGFGFVRRFFDFIQMAFPNDNHKLINTGFGGSTSYIFTNCIQTMTKDPDLVLVEFSVNDNSDVALDKPLDPKNPGQGKGIRSFEQLLRKALQLPSRPAVSFPRYGL